MIKISIVVPIYNAGDYLQDCLLSLIQQTLREIEIICVLDQPTDGSDKIVEKFASQDKRIKLIYNEKNLHVAESRNRGLAAAQGEYVGFSDHDDTRRLDMYEILYKAAKENNADIVFSNAIIRKNGIDKVYKYNDPTKEGVIRSLVLSGNQTQNKNFLSAVIWASIYKRNLIEENNLTFKNRNIYLEEDRIFNLKAFLHAKNIHYVNQPFYTWNKNNTSLSEQWGTNEGLTRLNFFELMTQTLKEANVFDRYRKEWKISLEYSLAVYYVFYKKLPQVHKKRLAKLLVENRFPIFARYKKLKILSKKRIKLYLFVFNFYALYWLRWKK